MKYFWQVRESRQELRRFMREARRTNPACLCSLQYDTLYIDKKCYKYSPIEGRVVELAVIWNRQFINNKSTICPYFRKAPNHQIFPIRASFTLFPSSEAFLAHSKPSLVGHRVARGLETETLAFWASCLSLSVSDHLWIETHNFYRYRTKRV